MCPGAILDGPTVVYHAAMSTVRKLWISDGFLVENPMDLTEPLEKLIKVGFGLSRDEEVEEIDVVIDDEEDDEEDDEGDDEDDYEDDVEEIDLGSLDVDEVMDEL